MLSTLTYLPSSKSFFLHLTPYCILCFLLYILVLARPAQAEVWLNDNLYFDNQHYLQLSFINNSSVNDSTTGFRLLPEFSLIQNMPTSFASKITIGSKLDLQTTNTHINTSANDQTETHSQAIINELQLTTALSPYWSFTLGRQKIAYAQQDLFRTSLNKNDRRPAPFEKLTFSQGLLTTLRLGVIEQSLLLNQKTENKESKPSVHYQLKIGIPGYKVGPLTLLLSQERSSTHLAINQITNRAMLGSAVQFPLGFITGDWQWAFQFATELNNAVNNQQAWQTSFSWLGFIPNHKLGILFSHTDSQWTYSDDFIPDARRTELRYQWRLHQRLTIALAANKTTLNSSIKTAISTEEDMALKVSFAF